MLLFELLNLLCLLTLDLNLKAVGYRHFNEVVIFIIVNSLAEDAELTPLLRLGAGACAGIIAMSATYPMDMVRGRLTVQVLVGDSFCGFNLCSLALVVSSRVQSVIVRK